ncbi:MAG TPA: LLM class F420-dependent oxidoreductase [Candidatus Binatia bacterium]|nr:LLM class F420-dependent oxidoreductase [Candidatus Binatia bacterium]
MRLGLQIPSFTWPGGGERIAPTLTRIAQAAEEAGFSSLWVMDHFFQIEMIGKPEEPMLEGYSALNFLAAVTKRIRLGTLVTGVIYRHPGVLVKTVTTLDVLSGGRTYFGVGAAWYEREAIALGIPFPPLKERFERLEETLQIALQMWSGSVAPFSGRHYRLAETLGRPQPITQPHPPIMIGGAGEKRTLPLVAKYADACNLYAFENVDAVRAKLAVLRRHCEAIGRPYEEIERTAIGALNLGAGGMTARAAVEYCRRVSDAGIQHFIVSIPGDYEITSIELIAKEVIPVVAEF